MKTWKEIQKEAIQIARDELLRGLSLCTKEEQNLFNRMYSTKGPNCPIGWVVQYMPINKIDWAIQQVARTLEKNIEALDV